MTGPGLLDAILLRIMGCDSSWNYVMDVNVILNFAFCFIFALPLDLIEQGLDANYYVLFLVIFQDLSFLLLVFLMLSFKNSGFLVCGG